MIVGFLGIGEIGAIVDAETVGEEDAGDGREVVGDDGLKDGTAVGPMAEIKDERVLMGGLIESAALVGGFKSDFGESPKAEAVVRVGLCLGNLKGVERTFAGVEFGERSGRSDVIGDKRRPTVAIGSIQDEALARRGNLVAEQENLTGALIADDPIMLGRDDDKEGIFRDAIERGAFAFADFAGGDADDGFRFREIFELGDGGDLGGEIAAGGVAEQGEFGQVGTNAPFGGRQNVERVVDRGEGIRQESLGRGRPIFLVARRDDDSAAASEMIDPGAVDAGIRGEPAVKKDDDRSFFRSRLGRLEEPIGLTASAVRAFTQRLMGISFRF